MLKRKPLKKRPWIQKGDAPDLNSPASMAQRTKFDNEDVPMFESKLDVRPACSAIVSFDQIPADRWAAIFGTPEEIAARRRQAIETQSAARPSSSALPNVIGDSQYEGYCPGLRKYVSGKAHRRELMRQANGGQGVRCVYDY